MNVNPVDGSKTKINCSVVTPIQNTLEKGQNVGDATKVISSATVGVLDIEMPKIDAVVSSHEVKENKENKKRREMQLAIMREQKEKQAEKGSER